MNHTLFTANESSKYMVNTKLSWYDYTCKFFLKELDSE